MHEKYTSNFTQPHKPGWYSGTQLPPTDVSDAGKTVIVDDEGKIGFGKDGAYYPFWDGSIDDGGER